MDCAWILCGLCADSVWIAHIDSPWSMDSATILYGFCAILCVCTLCMDCLWSMCGFSVDCAWILYGFCAASIWIAHGSSMDFV